MRLFFALLTVVLVACSNPIQTSESLWKSKNIVNYTFTFQRSCFCPPEISKPTVLTVKNGVLTSAVYADGNGNALLTYFTDVAPLEKLFRNIEGAQSGGYAVTVVYDATYGFPSSINASKNIPDASYTLTVTDFKPAP
jgi:Family of unknown function (DUF6174)